jgi:N-acetylmuramoyl-L-alanine amidase
MQRVRRGDTGAAVAEVRTILVGLELLQTTGEADGGAVFDQQMEHAVQAFQQQRGLITDGVVDDATYRALRDATYHLGSRPLSWTMSRPISGDDVLVLQERLLELGFDAGRPDGLFGSQTEHALRGFQREWGLNADGICGPVTVRALRQLAPKARGGRPVLLREQERMRRVGSRLSGKCVVIDPGHGGSDSGATARGVAEADLMWDLARRVEGRMKATGIDALLSRRPEECPTEAARADFANESGADLLLSLHCDRNASAHAQGLATFHYGTGSGVTSTIGEALAGFLQRELTTRTGLVDCRSHPRPWDILRLTRCPAVRLEVGYLTSAHDRVRLTDPAFRDLVADGVLIAVKRLYLLGEGDQPTGTFSVADVLRHELTP